MIRRYLLLAGLCLCPLSFAYAANSISSARELHFGEALFHAYQGNYVDAISRLDIGFKRYPVSAKTSSDPLRFQFGYSRFELGEFESAYRIPLRASGALTAIYDSKADRAVRNEAVFRLARMHMQDGQPEIALQTLKRISGTIPRELRDEMLALRAQIFLSIGKYADAASMLRELQDTAEDKGLTNYDLGIALIKSGQEKKGVELLDDAGRISGEDEATLSIRDKANLTLGYRMLDIKRPDVAKHYLERVRLSGPYSNRALLGSGWADVALEDYESALAPWLLLAKRNTTDEAVQESMLGVPYAYARLDLPGKAAKLYGKALDGFVQESTLLDTLMQYIREGRFRQALLREKLGTDKDWVIRLKSIQDVPGSGYLIGLMASGDLRDSIRNYIELNELADKLASWEESLASYEELIDLRRQYYAPLLVDFDSQFVPLDKRWRTLLERRKRLDGVLMGKIDKTQHEYEYFLSEEYRLAVLAINKHQQMDEDFQHLIHAHITITNLRKSITQSYQGYDDQIRQLRGRLSEVRQRAGALMTMQGQALDAIVIDRLDQRRQRIQEYQSQARFALAESYERASKKQEK